jgi:DNA adenine methylase
MPVKTPHATPSEAAVKRHGGKNGAIARWIISLMPSRARNSNAPADDDDGWVSYCEPYFGAGAVLFALDPRGISEVVNDLDADLTTFWNALKFPELFREFQRIIEATPVSQVEYEGACHDLSNGHQLAPVERAVAFFVRNRQSRQALEKDFLTPVKNRTRRGMNEHCSSWLSAVEGLPKIHARLKRVMIFNKPALEVIQSVDSARTLFFCDPPYHPSTRSARDAYKFEMTDRDHRDLLEALAEIKGRFLLSGYHCRLYDDFASSQGWRAMEFEKANSAGGGDTKRRMTEVIWTNF